MGDLVKAKATVKLQGVVAGQVVLVDPADEHIAKLISAKLLVVEPSDRENGSAGVSDDP